MRKLRTKFLFISFIVLIVLRLGSYFLLQPKHYAGEVLNVETVLDREPQIVSAKQVVSIDGMNAYLPIVPELHFGDHVAIKGVLECPRQEFHCQRYFVSKTSVKFLRSIPINPWLKAAFTIRSRFIEIYQSTLSNDEAELLTGIVLGGSSLDRQFKDRLANVGLTHVVAASGMNVSLFSVFAFWMVSFLRIRKLYKAILVISMILFYSTITGFDPPIVRAAIMAVISLVAIIIGRQWMGIWGLLMSAYVMLWASPILLVSPSFLLSFTAMAGQIILGSFSVTLPKNRNLFFRILYLSLQNGWQSLVAIIATFPIVVIFFAKFSLVSLFTNVLVLWTVEPLMILGGLAGIVGSVSNELARLVALPAGVLLSFFLWIVNVFGNNEKFILKIPGLDWTFLVGYYLILGGVILWWRQRKAVFEFGD